MILPKGGRPVQSRARAGPPCPDVPLALPFATANRLGADSMTSAVVTVGTFDGVHLGHQAVLARARGVASEGNLALVAYAFDVPPRQLAQGERGPGLLLPQATKEHLLLSWVDRVERAHFEDVRDLHAEAFVGDILVGRLCGRAVVVGEEFRFGQGGKGDLSLLRRIGRRSRLAVFAVPPVVMAGAPVSSSRIRALIRSGEVGQARELLGRPPMLAGHIVHGDGIGRTLGYPTANLSVDSSVLLPADGIYLVQAFVAGKVGPGLLYVGERPTVGERGMRCEVYLFASPEQDLYGAVLEAHLLARLRGSVTFASLEELRRQIDRDVALGRSLLASSDMDSRPILP